MKIFHLLFIAAATYSVVEAAEDSKNPASSRDALTIHEGLRFRNDAPTLQLDLFLPQNPPKAAPCVLIFQGGGFQANDGKRFRPFAEYLAENGFAAALVAYRGRPLHHYQDSLSDVRAAVRFLRANGTAYGIDPDRIGAIGHSAGATLAALLAVGEGSKRLDGGSESDPTVRIQAAVAISGVYDFIARFSDKEQNAMQPKRQETLHTNTEWIGTEFSRDADDWKRVSAINHVDTEDAPILLIHNRDDARVPWLQPRDMHERMKQAGVRSEIQIHETGGHGNPLRKKEAMLAFFKKTLIPPSTGK